MEKKVESSVHLESRHKLHRAETVSPKNSRPCGSSSFEAPDFGWAKYHPMHRNRFCRPSASEQPVISIPSGHARDTITERDLGVIIQPIPRLRNVKGHVAKEKVVSVGMGNFDA